MSVNVDYTAYNKAHTQPFDVNAHPSTEDDWRLYNAAHADPAAVPIESIQASPANIVEATATAHTADALPEPTSGAHASVRLASEPQPEDNPTATALAQYEAISPGLALAILEAEQSQSKQRRQYRMARLAVTTLIAVTAIACGQWALVNGADQQALYLSAAGLVSLLTTVLQHE